MVESRDERLRWANGVESQPPRGDRLKMQGTGEKDKRRDARTAAARYRSTVVHLSFFLSILPFYRDDLLYGQNP